MPAHSLPDPARSLVGLLPTSLSALAALAVNLRWSWDTPTRELFAHLDPAVWQATGDPLAVLRQAGDRRLATAAADPEFTARVAAAAADLDTYCTQPRWYDRLPPAPPRSIAYFSPEFGVTGALRQYSGGLGILAGDHLKTASDLGIPLIGVGLFYSRGYFTQTLDAGGWQCEDYPAPSAAELGLAPVCAAGKPVTVTVPLPGGREAVCAVWRVWIGRVPLLLLDSDTPGATAATRGITDRLYGGDAAHRLDQELVLGIGGVRAVSHHCAEWTTAEPEVYHSNEGHAAFLTLERVRQLCADGMAPQSARALVRATTVFTTHTPVPAGIDRFPREWVADAWRTAGGVPGLTAEELLGLGAEQDAALFNMAHLALRSCDRVNAVSVLHGRVSEEMFAPVLAEGVPEGRRVVAITNGVHLPTWAAPEVLAHAAPDVPAGPDALASAASAVGDTPDGGTAWHRFAALDDATLWALRGRLRERLLSHARRRLRDSWRIRGAMPAELAWTDAALDPDTLTIGFARRVPAYKRLTLMLHDQSRLAALLTDPQRPVQLIIAGKSHPHDDDGKRLIAELVQVTDRPDLRTRMVFLPDYDIDMARLLCAGCDVWLNTPLRPLEACGTSGMKAAANGGLNLSIRDGWWDECFDPGLGWAIPSRPDLTDAARDAAEAAALYDLLENSVIPLFYERVAGVPVQWLARVRHCLVQLGPRVAATRMLDEYLTRLYWPAALAGRTMR